MANEIIGRAEALAKGLTRYFTGKPCKHGHVAERLSSNGFCLDCSSVKNKRLRAENPELHRQRYRDWRAANPDKAKAAKLSWEDRNPDKVKAQQASQYRKHRVKRLAQQKEYSSKNADKILVRVIEWTKKNPDKSKTYKAKWAAKNPDVVRIIGHNRRARSRAADGRCTKSDIDRIFKAQKGKCAYCRTSLADGFDMDHIVPLAKGGSNHPSNIQLCCESCNCSKSARDPIDFAQSLGRLL